MYDSLTLQYEKNEIKPIYHGKWIEINPDWRNYKIFWLNLFLFKQNMFIYSRYTRKQFDFVCVAEDNYRFIALENPFFTLFRKEKMTVDGFRLLFTYDAPLYTHTNDRYRFVHSFSIVTYPLNRKWRRGLHSHMYTCTLIQS